MFSMAGMKAPSYRPIPSGTNAQPHVDKALHAAVDAGDQAAVLANLKDGAGINSRDRPGGVTPLMRALEQGHREIATLLFLHGGAVTSDSEGTQLLGVLLKFACDSVEQARATLEQAGCHKDLQTGFPPYVERLAVLGTLIHLIEKNDSLKQKFRLNQETFNVARRCFPGDHRFAGKLHYPGGRKAILDDLRSILRDGDKSRVSDYDKKLALEFLLKINCRPVAEFMLNDMPRFKGTLQTARGNRQTQDEKDPLRRQALQAKWGDVWAADILQMAAFRSNAKTLRMVLAANLADVNQGFLGMLSPANTAGRKLTPLMYAVLGRNQDGVVALLQCGARMDLRCNAGHTALDYVFSEGLDLPEAERKTMAGLFLSANRDIAMDILFKSKRLSEVSRMGSEYIEMADRPQALKAAFARCATPAEKARTVAAILAAYPSYVGVEGETLDKRRDVLCALFAELASSAGEKEIILRETADAYFRLQKQCGEHGDGNAYAIFRLAGDRLEFDWKQVKCMPGMLDLLKSIGYAGPR